MYEIRHAGAKGFGVFATRSIPRGTRILAERPAFTVRSESEVFAATRRLGETERRNLMQLSVSPVRQSSVLSWAEAIWHGGREVLADVLRSAQGDEKPANAVSAWGSLMEYPGVLSVFRNNNFDIGNGVQAFFKDICRLNHACAPNAQGNFNTALGRFTIHAVRPIDAKEEITLSYLAEHGALRDARQSRLLDRYGFLCDCPGCDTAGKRSQEGEERRRRMQVRLQTYAEEAAERETPDPEAELKVMRGLIEMYEAEGIAGREVATMCLSAAELASKMGRRDEVRRLCEIGLRLDEEAVGADGPMFEESVVRVKAMGMS